MRTLAPVSPFNPGNPTCPLGPVLPSSPFSPLRPGSPATPCKEKGHSFKMKTFPRIKTGRRVNTNLHKLSLCGSLMMGAKFNDVGDIAE